MSHRPTRLSHATLVLLGMAAAVGCRDPLPSDPPPDLVERASPRTRLEIGGAQIVVDAQPTVPASPKLVEWVRHAANMVTAYFGRFPVPELEVTIVGRRGGAVGFGQAFSGRLIKVRVGPDATPADLYDDWVLVHEMLHLGFPDLAARHKWMQEGLSTYLEPVVRAHAGVVAPAEVWQNWVERMPHGLPGPGDAGLDHTPTWGRTYWGGAIFWLLVDIEVRRRTDGRCSIRTILLALLDAGGDHRVTWPIERVLEASDAAVGVPVFTELYRQHARASTDVELDTLWTELGIVVNGDSVTFDDSAPLASVRAAILDPGWH